MTISDLDQRGFVRVTTPNEDDIWLTCQQCHKSDHFLLDQRVECACGANYDHAITPGGARVAMEGLSFVEFSKGPLGLADTELDPRKIALLSMIVLVLGWLIWSSFAG